MGGVMRREARSITVLTVLVLALHVGIGSVRSDPEPSASILAWYDLPKEDRRSVELSGIAWDEGSSTLFAVTDDAPSIVRLVLSDDFKSVSFGEAISVAVSDPWDGEGIAQTSSGFLISNETGPHIYELDSAGQFVRELQVPAHFDRIRPNLSLESLTVADGGRYIFTANEQALNGDGPQSTPEAGTMVRIVRHDRVTAATLEWAYMTDAVFAAGADGGNGVVDLAALSPSDLLVLERSFVDGVGNSVRIYRVTLNEPTEILDVEALAPETSVVSKTLLLDLATLPEDNFPPSLQPQPSRILDNFEGLALGPMLLDGRRVLFLISDDNRRATQIPRLLILAVPGL
jgi:hypothetical protein